MVDPSAHSSTATAGDSTVRATLTQPATPEQRARAATHPLVLVVKPWWLWLAAVLVLALLIGGVALGLAQNQQQQDLAALRQQLDRARLDYSSLQTSIDLNQRQQQNAWDKLIGLEQRLDSVVAFDGLTLPVAESLNQVNRALQFLGQVQWGPLQPSRFESATGASKPKPTTQAIQPSSKALHQTPTGQGLANTAASAEPHSDNPLLPIWYSTKQWLIDQLGEWIRLRPIASVDLAQMDAAQVQSARAQLTVQLLSARLALLSNQVPLARQHLNEAQKLAQRIFHPRVSDQQRVLQAIALSITKLQ